MIPVCWKLILRLAVYCSVIFDQRTRLYAEVTQALMERSLLLCKLQLHSALQLKCHFQLHEQTECPVPFSGNWMHSGLFYLTFLSFTL